MWGALLDSVYLHTRSRDSLDERVWPILVPPGGGGDRALARARPRDLGGARRAQALHVLEDVLLGGVRSRRPAGRAARGLRSAPGAGARRPTRSRPTCCEHGVDERGVFVQHYETDALDAALLLLPLMRFLPPDDERIRRDRVRDRRRADRGRPGPALPHRGDRRRPARARRAAFLICSFWLVSALCEIGELDRARALCERLLGYASPLGLYAEEIDPRTGRHLGNFPQAFTHLALINAVMHVIRADEEARRRPSPLVELALAGNRPEVDWLLRYQLSRVGRSAPATSRYARRQRDRQRLQLVDEAATPPPSGRPAISIAGKRASVSSNMIRSSSRASAAPRQKCRPPAPNAWCSGLRRDVEAVRILVARLVAVGGHVPHHDLLALADRLPGELGVARRGAAEVRERGEHPQRLLDRARDQRRIGEQRCPLARGAPSAPACRCSRSPSCCRCRPRRAGRSPSRSRAPRASGRRSRRARARW